MAAAKARVRGVHQARVRGVGGNDKDAQPHLEQLLAQVCPLLPCKLAVDGFLAAVAVARVWIGATHDGEVGRVAHQDGMRHFTGKPG